MGISKDEFMDILEINGFKVTYDDNMPVVLCDDTEGVGDVAVLVKKIAKDTGYNYSWGVRPLKMQKIFDEMD